MVPVPLNPYVDDADAVVDVVDADDVDDVDAVGDVDYVDDAGDIRWGAAAVVVVSK